jgi:hypothetical protein
MKAYTQITTLFLLTIGLAAAAQAQTVIEVYEDEPILLHRESAPFFESTSFIDISFIRGKRIVAGETREYLSKDLNVRVTNPNFSGFEYTSAVFMNVCTDRRTNRTTYEDVFWSDLYWTGESFQSQNHVVVFDKTSRTRSAHCVQEIALVSNGYWMTDPESGTHNFRYSMRDAE